MKSRKKNLADGVLYTDFYQLTMAQLYFRQGLHETEAQFDYFFRSYPDYGGQQAGYCVNAGMEWLLDWLDSARVGKGEIECLRRQTGRSKEPVFDKDFLAWLEGKDLLKGLSIRAIPEGRIVHPSVPLAVVQGPLAMAQILESSLLNHLNYQTLIATKACRIREAGEGNLLIDFGMRRAQERGADAGARAALIGGADFSSHTGLSCALGYPPKGTHAHSMVQVFMALGGGEEEAFQAYADVYPDDCLLLVDTINTLESGVPNAIRVFEKLRKRGHEPVGIRLDSGDLAHLSIRAARMLDDAGFPDAVIVLSNQLDEMVTWQILTQIREEAPRLGVDPDKLIGRLAYGVGTRLITSKGCGALDGVYKLTAVRKGGSLVPAFKISENPEKVINPGDKKVWRIYDRRGKAVADLLSLGDEDPGQLENLVLRHPVIAAKQRTLSRDDISEIEPLLDEVLVEGKRFSSPTIEEMRQLRNRDLERLDSGVKRLVNPHVYHVSLTEKLWKLKQDLLTAYTKNEE